jgi:hypothetical protein
MQGRGWLWKRVLEVSQNNKKAVLSKREEGQKRNESSERTEKVGGRRRGKSCLVEGETRRGVPAYTRPRRFSTKAYKGLESRCGIR